MPIIVPPAEEQSAIIRFLTSSDQGISQFIQAKLRLIDLLEVQKQAIIDRLVTYGVNPSASLKPSGIEWIGDLPEHWDTMRLKRGTTPIEQGWSPQCDAQPAGDNEWGVLKVGCVNKDYFDGGQNKRLPDFLEPRPALEVCDGDILVSRANTRELLGLAALAVAPRRKLLLCDKLFRFRPLPQRFDSRFLVHSIRCRSSRAQIESSANGASDSMQNIGQNVIKNLWLAAPPVHEQQEIVDAISVETDEIRRVIARTEREINLVREYRTRLIADVVTGRLDVRQAAAKLHDVPEEIPTSDVAEGLEEEVSLEAVEAES
jgi:type I restriction enzyme S subunit